MPKGNKLSEFEKGEITSSEKSQKSRREISKAFLGRSKIVICSYLKSPNKYGTRKPTGRPEKLSQFTKRIVHEVKNKTSSTSKILKSLVGSPCATRTIKRHLNNEWIKHKERIHRPRLTMKHKEKRVKYPRQYQTMSAKEWRKVDFSDEKKFNLDGSDGFSEVLSRKIFSKRELITQQGIIEEDLFWSGGGGVLIFRKTDYNLSAVDKK